MDRVKILQAITDAMAVGGSFMRDLIEAMAEDDEFFTKLIAALEAEGVNSKFLTLLPVLKTILIDFFRDKTLEQIISDIIAKLGVSAP